MPGLAAAEASGWAVAAAGAIATVTAVYAVATIVVAVTAVASIAAALGHGWDGGGQVGAAFGIDDEVALLAFAYGGGFHAFQGFEGEVEHAAFAGVGGREAVGLAGLADALGGGFGGCGDLLLSKRLEVEGVEADEIVFADVEAEDLDGDVLEGAEEFAAALGEERGVGAGQFDVEDLGSGVLRVCGGGTGADAVLQAQAAEADDGVEEAGDLLGGLLQILDRHDKSVSQSGLRRGNFCHARGHLDYF